MHGGRKDISKCYIPSISQSNMNSTFPKIIVHPKPLCAALEANRTRLLSIANSESKVSIRYEGASLLHNRRVQIAVLSMTDLTRRLDGVEAPRIANLAVGVVTRLRELISQSAVT